jgi:hypothetical protein
MKNFYRFWDEYFKFLAKGHEPNRPHERVWLLIQKRLRLLPPRSKVRH